MAKKVLLVEDDPLLTDIYTTKLKELDIELLHVDDGEKVIPTIRKERPDLVILDIVLPHMDGWDILVDIKSDEAIKDTKVMVLSNLGQKDEIDKGLQLGAAEYLIKAHETPTQIAEAAKKLLKQ